MKKQLYILLILLVSALFISCSPDVPPPIDGNDNQPETEKLSYWRTYTGIEVDAVIGDARIAIEIKSANEVKPKHRKGLQEFAKDYPGARLILVSLDRLSRRSSDVECLYVMDFLRMMWSGGLAASL